MDYTKIMTRDEAIQICEEIINNENLQKMIPKEIRKAIEILLKTVENQSLIIAFLEDMGY